MTNNDFFKPVSVKDFGASLFIHVLIIFIGLIFTYRKASLDALEPAVKLSLAKKKKMIDSAVRVDVVSMPKLTVKEMRKMKLPSRKVSKSIPKLKKVALKTPVKKLPPSSNSTKNSFKSLLKNLSSKKIDLKNVKKKQAAPSNKAKSASNKLSEKVRKQLAALNDLALEGNKISKGNQLISDKITLKEQKVNLEQYAQQLIGAVRPNWKLPSYLIKKKISCQVRVYVSENGDLINTEIYKSSGDSEFDSRAISAVEKSAPFEVPDMSIRTRLVAGEILLGFPL